MNDMKTGLAWLIGFVVALLVALMVFVVNTPLGANLSLVGGLIGDSSWGSSSET